MHRVRYECFLGTLVYYMNTWPHLGKRLTTFCEGPATFIDVDTCQGPKLVAGAGAAKSPIWWISTQQTYRPMNWVTVQSRRSQKILTPGILYNILLNLSMIWVPSIFIFETSDKCGKHQSAMFLFSRLGHWSIWGFGPEWAYTIERVTVYDPANG